MAVNVWLRIFFYGIHGFFDEILFTSLFNFVESNFIDWRFRGHSSMWSFFMYGFGSFVIEQLYLMWKDKTYLPMPVRGVLYVLWVYLWEFSCGMLLRYFNACPWDYSSRQWNLCGLITLQYFPAWYAASLWQELVTRYLLTLSKDTADTERKDSWSRCHGGNTHAEPYPGLFSVENLEFRVEEASQNFFHWNNYVGCLWQIVL